jgi:hypothetical protein
LQTLDLSNQNLTGSIPSSYTSLRNLQSFSLANNSPISEIPVGFATSAGLEAFSVSGNGLNGTIPANLGALSKLSSLSLSNNLLSGQIPVPMGNDFNLAVPLLRTISLMGRSQMSSVHSPTSKDLTSAGTNFLAAFLQTWQTAAGCPILVRTETIGWEKSQLKSHS